IGLQAGGPARGPRPGQEDFPANARGADLCKLCKRDFAAPRRMRMIGFSAKTCLSVAGTLVLLASALCSPARAAAGYEIFVSNEHAGTVSVIDGGTFKVLDTITVGKRPRGIHASPDGKTVYVALSGTPIEGPPPLDAQGNPILKK